MRGCVICGQDIDPGEMSVGLAAGEVGVPIGLAHIGCFWYRARSDWNERERAAVRRQLVRDRPQTE